MSRFTHLTAAVALGAALLTGSSGAHAGLVGLTVHPVFYADIPDPSEPPRPFDTTIVNDDEPAFRIANGSTFSFTDPPDSPYGGTFGTYMSVTFSDTQIILTNLIEGVYPPYTAVEFKFLSGSILSVAKNLALSSPLFEPGSILSVTGNTFRLDLSGTCVTCEGTANGGPGENIVLNVSAVPEPETVALIFLGLIPLTWRRWKRG